MWNSYSCESGSIRVDGSIPAKYATLTISPYAAHRVTDDRREAGLVLDLKFEARSGFALWPNLESASIAVAGKPEELRAAPIDTKRTCGRYMCSHRIQAQVTFTPAALAEIRMKFASSPEGAVAMRFFYKEIGSFTYEIPTREIIAVVEASALFEHDVGDPPNSDG
jgi:hypothetical protein